MPAILAWLMPAVFLSWGMQILKGFGLGIVAFTGAEALLSVAESKINGYLSELPAAVFNIVLMMGVKDALSMLFSAYTASVVIKRLIGGERHYAWKPPGQGGLTGGA